MSRPRNDDLKARLRIRKHELEEAHPLEPNLIKVLAAEFGLSTSTAWYHLRKPSDGRRKYSDKERAYLADLTWTQIKTYAVANDLNAHTLYSVKLRELRGDSAHVASEVRRRCEFMGFMDFSRRGHLKALGFSEDAFARARKAVRGIQGLDLLGPNYLTHPPSGKLCILSLPEQRALLKDSTAFIHKQAASICQRWRQVTDHTFYLLDTATRDEDHSGTVIGVYPTLGEAARVQSHYMAHRGFRPVMMVMCQRGLHSYEVGDKFRLAA